MNEKSEEEFCSISYGSSVSNPRTNVPVEEDIRVGNKRLIDLRIHQTHVADFDHKLRQFEM